MFQIALCEDEEVFAETQEQLCREILGRMSVEYGLSVFRNGRDFLAAFSDGGRRFDLVLLDIVIEDFNGMELARKIRETDRSAGIVFITSSRAYAMEGYDVAALHYLTKPVDVSLLERLIKKVYEEKFLTGHFLLKSGARNRRIAVRDIVALETVGRKVEITMMDERLYYSGKLADLLGELPSGCFVRCHQAFAVHIGNIREIDRFEAVAVNGKRVPISRPYMKAVQAAFLMSMQ